MKKRQILACILAMEMLVTTIYPSSTSIAVETGSQGGAETEETTTEDESVKQVDDVEEEESTQGGTNEDAEESGKGKNQGEVKETQTETETETETELETETETETEIETEAEMETETETETEIMVEEAMLARIAVNEEVELIADFDFEDLEDGESILIGGAKATGEYTLVESITDGMALHLDGSSQYLDVTTADGDSLLTGLKEMTISYEAMQERSSTNWIMYASNDLSAPEYRYEQYIGLLQSGEKLTAERYNNNGGRVSCPSTAVANDWVHVDVVFEAEQTIIYVNGTKKASEDSSYALTDILGEDSILQIGKANWGSGEYFEGAIDNFRIYSGALSASEINEQYQDYLNQINSVVEETELTLNAGFIGENLTLPATFDGGEVSWKSSDANVITDEGVITRGDVNKEATLIATVTKEGEDTVTKEFPLVVLAAGQTVATYVSNDPATGQAGGMEVAVETEDGFEELHKGQPILYTAKGNKSFAAPVIFRKADGEGFGVIAADGGSNGNIIVYDSEDLITYENERSITLSEIKSIEKLFCVYDMADERYKIYIENGSGKRYLVTSEDMEKFSEATETAYTFSAVDGMPDDATWGSKVALTKEESERLVNKFTNVYNTGIENLPGDITIETGEDLEEALAEVVEKNGPVKAEYSDGTKKELDVRFNRADMSKISTTRPGTYTLRGIVGGSSYYVEADDPLITERADPYIVYNEQDGYYYFTASYPMYGSSDADGYDRLILRRAKTIAELDDAEEVTIWDEEESSSLGRFIWAPELHKIGDSWYFISTAGQNTGTGTSFNIRPFMIKCNDAEDMMNPDSWGDPVNVRAMAGDETKCLNGMSLDMTYFEAGGTHYLVWADETQDNTSDLYIATIDPKDPTQLTSPCSIITVPEYSWERVTYNVNEGPAVIENDGTIYLAFSASGTGSEYCVGYMQADAEDDLTNPDNWEKNRYPILTSADFDDELSGPGHNSFTVDENGEPLIVFHARPAKEHASKDNLHGGDSLYDPCRSTYVKPVFFDADGVPVLNMSDEEFAGEDGSVFEITVTVSGETVVAQPILAYTFDEDYEEGVVKDSVGENDAVITEGAAYVQDAAYGQVLYLDGDEEVGGSNSYLTFPEGFFDNMDTMTISMDINEVTRSGNYFTFAIGQDTDKYIFLKTAPTELVAAITKSGNNAEKRASASGAYPNNARTWINVKIVITADSLSIYRDGELAAVKQNTGIKMSQLGEELKAYLGKSFFGDDLYFRGYFDNVKVYDFAMTDQEVAELSNQEEKERKEAIEDVARVADLFEIPNAKDIRGNITLPSIKDGVSISWTSSDEDIISTKVIKNNDYDETPAGVVNRQDVDKDVTLTAVFSKEGQTDHKKTYHVTVKAKPEEITEDDYAGYLFVHFTGSEADGTQEQTYFSLSEDGLNWEDLNKNNAVLTSTIGESGLRDHYIARSPEGDKFYMIATDLSIYHNSTSTMWPEAGSNGSHSIVVWESTDLVNWSEPWFAEIAPEGAGCTWAPEFIYDEQTGEYVVYWSATTLKTDDDGNITQEYENHSIYYAKTRDFHTFTEPEVYHEGGKSNGKIVKVIDSTMIQEDGTFYRYTKNESKGIIEIDQSDAVLGEFDTISSKTLTTDVYASVGAVEGPIIYKLNDKTEDGEEQWCLMVDRYGTGSGYYPLLTTDLASGEFSFLASSEYSMPSKYRHGYVMSVTKEEYTALQQKWGDENYGNTKTLEKSNSGNPMLGFDENGDILYGGDPSILVDGDTVYAYVGHDTSSTESYRMPDWRCYSSKDMKNWTYESTILTENTSNITWAADAVSAWAGQVVKGSNGKYYFYYCTETNSANGGGKSIGVAVSDTATGPFTDIGKPLVRNIDTPNGVSTWEDIDPTFWLEEDENGVEHRYLGWGNSRFFLCELNEDMISIQDQDGDASTISVGYGKGNDIVIGKINGMGSHTFTEAPYYYRQQDDEGNYYGYYYMFFACDWREQMAYAYTDDIADNTWTFGGVLMEPSATANTNHMAVFDFKGQTYFVYHDGSLPHGSGFRRVACVEKMSVNKDGTIDPIKKTAIGLTGTLSNITDYDGNYVASETFTNTLNDADYPMTDKGLVVDFYQDGDEAGWEINPGKLNAKKDEYVSIESNYKPGLYISVGDPEDGVITPVLAQDVNGTTEESKRMTFRTLNGFAGEGVTFESVMYPGYYLVSRDGTLLLAEDVEDKEATFYVSTDSTAHKSVVQKTVRFYTAGATLKTDDIRIQMYLGQGKVERVLEYTTNAADIDMNEVGDHLLEVTYKYDNKTYTDSVKIHIAQAAYRRTVE